MRTRRVSEEAPSPILRAPFPYFGGKSRAADVVWRAFGNVPNYVEPFAGSLAVLLARPHAAKIETVNDVDAMVSNFWRAVAGAPEEVARWCDWPVSEPDMHARHRWLVWQLPEHRTRMVANPDYYDAKIAGWWVWGLSMWIGSGWCDGRLEQKRPNADGHHAWRGVHRKMPDLYTRGNGRGVRSAASEKVPNVGNVGRGVHSFQILDLQGAGKGINAPTRLPSLGNMRGVHGTREGRWEEGAPRTADGPPCLEWFRALQVRLRRTRVCSGDWTRVLSDSVLGMTKSRTSGMNPCGVLLDPPYGDEARETGLYADDDMSLAAKVAAWARERGGDPDLRIALCGYEGEHDMPGWTCHAWKALRGYAREGNKNAERERIWFSPHCLPIDPKQGSLFGEP